MTADRDRTSARAHRSSPCSATPRVPTRAMTPAALTPAGICAIARRLYTDGPLAMRAMQHWRAHICPLDLVLEQVPQGAYVLDVGCGGGLLLGVLAWTGRIRAGVGIDV